MGQLTKYEQAVQATTGSEKHQKLGNVRCDYWLGAIWLEKSGLYEPPTTNLSSISVQRT